MATQERSDSPTLRNTKIIGTASQRRRKKGRAAKDLPLQRSQDPRSDRWRFFPRAVARGGPLDLLNDLRDKGEQIVGLQNLPPDFVARMLDFNSARRADHGRT
jgi:hypothetical protein